MFKKFEKSREEVKKEKIVQTKNKKCALESCVWINPMNYRIIYTWKCSKIFGKSREELKKNRINEK